MPSSTSLLEAELEPGVQGPCEPRETLVGPMPCPGSHVALRGAVLDLQPLGEATGAGSAAEEVDTVALLTQAPLPAFASVVLPGLDSPEGVMMVPAAYGEVGFETEVSALGRRKSVNSTECVAVPSSEHVAEIVGRQGCKIKALRAKTNTYIKTPVRGEQPVFVVTGRKEDVAVAKREILSAAEHFSLIRASRNKPGTLCGSGLGPGNSPVLPGQTTIQVRVPYRVVGLVVGPKGATIKRIQQQTHTYIVTPSRDKEPVFEVTGMPENVDRAREEIEAHIAVRTGSCAEACADDDDFHCNGTDVSFEGDAAAGSGGRAGATVSSAYRSSSCSSSESFYSGAGGRVSDYSPTGPFGGSGFWFGENVLSLSSDDLELSAFEALTVAVPPIAGHQVLWGPFEQGLPLLEGRCPGPCHDSQPSSPRLSPTFHETLELPGSVHACSEPVSARCPRFPVSGMAFSSSSSGDSTTSSSPPDSAGPVSSYRRGQDCVHCLESDTVAALVPCGHNFFCMECANRICQGEEPVCPMCQMPVTQALRLRNV